MIEDLLSNSFELFVFVFLPGWILLRWRNKGVRKPIFDEIVLSIIFGTILFVLVNIVIGISYFFRLIDHPISTWIYDTFFYYLGTTESNLWMAVYTFVIAAFIGRTYLIHEFNLEKFKGWTTSISYMLLIAAALSPLVLKSLQPIPSTEPWVSSLKQCEKGITNITINVVNPLDHPITVLGVSTVQGTFNQMKGPIVIPPKDVWIWSKKYNVNDPKTPYSLYVDLDAGSHQVRLTYCNAQ